MGSPTISNSKPETAMEKKSIKDKFIKPIQALFSNKKKEKTKKEVDLTEEFEKLQIKNKEQKTSEKVAEIVKKIDEKVNKKNEQNDDDEFNKNFTVKVIEEKDTDIDRSNRDERIGSQTSEDSGFAEGEAEKEKEDTADDEKEEDVIESMQNLKIDGKEKKVQNVVIARGLIKTGLHLTPSTHPYSLGKQAKVDYNQINQVNRQTFSGGHVTVARPPTEFTEVDIAVKNVVSNAPHYSLNTPQAQDYLNMVQEYIDEDCSEPKEEESDILAGFFREACDTENLHNFVQSEISKITEPNPIEEFSNATHINYEEYANLESITNFEDEFLNENCNSIFPTPPREYISSPMSDSQSYPSNSEYQLSPPLSSPLTNDYESYQEISQIDDSILPTFVTDGETQKKRERNGSSSSMTMKQYKDKQKELSMDFSKHECCQMNKKSCKEIFEGHMKKLKAEERRSLCLKVANLDMKTAYGVLQHILLSLSHETEEEDLQYALFALICDRVVAEQPELFVQDFGLNLVKPAALRCPHRPILTRLLVQCVYAALKGNPDLFKGKDAIFREIDAQGDNLLVACARAGDSHADVLAELVAAPPTLPVAAPPLFLLHHHNTEGYSALHVACRLHSAARPHLRVTHVLLAHAGADLWRGVSSSLGAFISAQGSSASSPPHAARHHRLDTYRVAIADVKGADTALHLAVNSPTCDLNLVLTIFKHVDRKQWKKLAHVHNRSSVTPLEYARCATKSTTRQDYPPEVLEFLKKCR